MGTISGQERVWQLLTFLLQVVKIKIDKSQSLFLCIFIIWNAPELLLTLLNCICLGFFKWQHSFASSNSYPKLPQEVGGPVQGYEYKWSQYMIHIYVLHQTYQTSDIPDIRHTSFRNFQWASQPLFETAPGGGCASALLTAPNTWLYIAFKI